LGEWPSQDIAPASYENFSEIAGYRGFKSHLARFEIGDIVRAQDFEKFSIFCNLLSAIIGFMFEGIII
jgi:hypothetical protein